MADTIKMELPDFKEREAILARARQLRAETMANLFRAAGRGIRNFFAPARTVAAH